MIVFYFGSPWQQGSAITDRASSGRLKLFRTATELTGIICCITRMIITEWRLQLISGSSVFRLAKSTVRAKKGTCSASGWGVGGALSAIHLSAV